MSSSEPEYFWYRGQKCNHCRAVIPTFALGHYKPEKEGKDLFSKRIVNFYEWGNEKECVYFRKRLIELYEKRFKGDIVFDIICAAPTHLKDELNTHIVALARDVGSNWGITFKQVVRRRLDTKPQHTLTVKEERLSNVAGSIEIVGDVSGKNVLVLDNTSIYGATFQEIFDCLKKAGAGMVVFICLGLGSKGKECDFDLNPALRWKTSEIIRKLHWPRLSKEKRASFKLERTCPESL